MRTRIKICGITRAEDGQAAVRLGIDALGFVFYPPSSRALSAGQAAELAATIPAFVTKVALFLDPELALVDSVIEAIQPDLLQFHGSEAAAFCSRFRRPYIKALALGDENIDIDAQLREHVAAVGFLVDSHRAGQAGGSGQVFDWTRLPKNLNRPMVLAGGLSPDNVAQAIRQLRPYAVDVSSGVESAPGIKDAEKMRQFAEQVRLADAE